MEFEALLSPDTLSRFFLCSVRVVSLFAALPIFGSQQTPDRVRTGLGVALALVVFPVVDQHIPAIPMEPLIVGLAVINEGLLGFLIGLMARLIFTAVEFGGTIIGYQMGFAAANVFDPQSQRQTSLMSQFQNVIAILFFLALNGHHIFLQAIVHSYQILPVGNLDLSGQAVPYLMELASDMFALAVRFSAPVLAVLLLSGFVLGLMARVFPQLNVFMLSFPLNIGLSFLVIGLTLNMVAALLGREFDAIGERMITFFRML